MSTRTLLAGLTSLALVATASCGSSGSDAGTEAPTTTAAPADPVVTDLAGRYAHFDVVAYEDDVMKTLIISYGFADLEPDGEDLVWTPSFCFSEHRSDQPISVEFSDAATQAIKPVSGPATVTVDGDRVTVSRPATPTAVGARLEDPANDPLPTDPDDPRIVDDDGDGNPGVTARITVSEELTGEIYLARREIFAYDVELQDDGSLTGSVKDSSEQLIIGASDELFLTDAQWEQHPDPARSPIILRPVDADWDCDRLRAERDDLFPPTPEVDW